MFGIVTATTITDIYYISKKGKGHNEAIEFIANLLQIVDVLGVNKEVILSSIESEFLDFEDAIQSIVSSFNNIDIIITRNTKDFLNSEIKAISPSEFLAQNK